MTERLAPAPCAPTSPLTSLTCPPICSLLTRIDASNSDRFVKLLESAREQAAGASESDLRRLKRQVRERANFKKRGGGGAGRRVFNLLKHSPFLPSYLIHPVRLPEKHVHPVRREGRIH